MPADAMRGMNRTNGPVRLHASDGREQQRLDPIEGRCARRALIRAGAPSGVCRLCSDHRAHNDGRSDEAQREGRGPCSATEIRPGARSSGEQGHPEPTCATRRTDDQPREQRRLRPAAGAWRALVDDGCVWREKQVVVARAVSRRIAHQQTAGLGDRPVGSPLADVRRRPARRRPARRRLERPVHHVGRHQQRGGDALRRLRPSLARSDPQKHPPSPVSAATGALAPSRR